MSWSAHLNRMIDAHHQVLGDLGDYLNGRRDSFHLPDLHDCPLHDWLGRADEELNAVHHEFHECCSDALRLARTGRLDGARARLSTAYRHCGRLSQLITQFDPVVA